MAEGHGSRICVRGSYPIGLRGFKPHLQKVNRDDPQKGASEAAGIRPGRLLQELLAQACREADLRAAGQRLPHLEEGRLVGSRRRSGGDVTSPPVQLWAGGVSDRHEGKRPGPIAANMRNLTMTDKRSKAFKVWRNSLTGELMSEAQARHVPDSQKQREHMPKRGEGDTGRGKARGGGKKK